MKADGKQPYPNAIIHPHPGDNGEAITINEPTTPSAVVTWTDSEATAVFVPAGAAPAVLNGIAVAPWTENPKTEAGWEQVSGQLHDLVEPLMNRKGKAPAAGVVIVEPDGRVWMVKPSNGFAGYTTTFPKGHADTCLSLQATAIREAFEESGLQVEIIGMIGDVERGLTMTRYYLARRVGGSPTAMGWESQAVVLSPPGSVHDALNRQYDRTVASLAGMAAGIDSSAEGLSVDGWKKTGEAVGSNPGGFFVDPTGQEWYVKVPKSIAIAKNEVLAAKLYESAGVTVPDLKLVTLAGKIAIGSKRIAGLRKLPKDGHGVSGLMDGFVVDAWLANWDVVGLVHDNLLCDPHGHAVRVDVGGSLLFRAQGEPKGNAFNDNVDELETLTNGKNPQAAAVFGDVTCDELQTGIARVAAVSPAAIRLACQNHGSGSIAERATLSATLIARRAYLIARQRDS